MPDFAHTLKTWRKTRRFSQLDLAMEAEVSARHISFLESGRARPSREMIGRLGDAMNLPLNARNQMLTHAGFAARFPSRPWDAEAMAPIRAAVDHMLERHAPYPALAFNRLWSILRMNSPARALFAPLGIGEGDSLLDAMLGEALPALIENWPEVAHHAALRLQTESASQGGVPQLDRAAARLAQIGQPAGMATGPVVPTRYRLGPLNLSLFATIAQFGTPEDLTLDDLKIELYFPADDETAQSLRAMAMQFSGNS